MAWLIGNAKTTYTHHSSPVTLTPKSPQDKDKLSFSKLVQSSIPPCHLNPFLFNGHLQTMYTAMKAAGPPIHYKRHIFESTHSVYPGQFTVDFVVPPINPPHTPDPTLPERTTFFTEAEFQELASDDKTPMLICLHGLTGGSHEIYLREVIAPMVKAGWAACVVNGRGCALAKITTPYLFSPRSTWDLRQLVSYLGTIFPNRPLFGVGCSMGANILTNYVGEEGEKCKLKAAVAISNPWNLELCNAIMKRSWLGMEVYHRAFGKSIKVVYERNKEVMLTHERLDAEKTPAEVKACRYLWDFDR